MLHFFKPRYGNHQFNFNACSIAPLVKYVNSEFIKLNKIYQRKIPGSRQSIEYLEKIWSESKDLLQRFLNINDKFEIQLFSGTSRALDYLLLKYGNIENIIISPYEHPAEISVANWNNKLFKSKVFRIYFDEQMFSSHWDKQKDRIVDDIVSVCLKKRSTLVLISEVCYSTGYVIKVKEIISDVFAKCKKKGGITPQFIIDGAQSVGNIKFPQAMKLGFPYFFCGHKWLFAPLPSGIVIDSVATSNWYCYDSWGKSLPQSTGSAYLLFGLYASLKLHSIIGLDNRIKKVNKLRDIFKVEISNFFHIVGDASGLDKSFILSIVPKKNARWKVKNQQDLHHILSNSTINAQIINAYNKLNPWVRISFSYFQKEKNVIKLCNILNSLINF